MAVTIWAAIETFLGGLMMIILPDGVVEVQLTRGLVTLIDDEDFELVSQFKWCAVICSNTNYAHKKHGKRTISLHRFLLNPPE